MNDPDVTTTNHGSVSRRGFLKVAGAGVAGSSLLTMLEARQAPAQLKGTTLRILQWSHFIPAYDAWYDKFAKEWGDKNGVKVRVDHIPHLDIPARMAAEFAAGAGHDVIYNGSSILTRLYYKNLVDLTDIADAAGKNLKYPDTWELARVAARTLKPKGHPTGIALSQCADANLFWRSMFFSFGGTEADPSGANPTLDSKELREFLTFAKAIFNEGMTPEVFSWDDASDNRYLASGVACWVHDAISAYRTTEDTNPPVFQNTFLGLEPQGLPGKRVSVAAPNVWMVWKFSKNQQAAKEWLTYLIDNDLEGMVQSRGYNMPYLTDRYKKPMPVIGTDPKLQILQDFPKIVAFYGYPGPSTTPIQEIVNTFIFPDMVTRACRGKESIEDSIKWGVGEYRRVYAKHKQA